MAQNEDLSIDQGTDVSVDIYLSDINGEAKDLTGYLISAKMKKTYNSDSDNTTIFNTSAPYPQTTGLITISLNGEQTNAIKPGRYVYDVFISFEDSDSNVAYERILEGNIDVTPSVTRRGDA